MLLAVYVLASCASAAKDLRRDQERGLAESQDLLRKDPPRTQAGRGSGKRRKRKPGRTQEVAELDALATRLGAKALRIESACLDGECERHALDRIFEKLDALDRGRRGRVRILHLGDSHVAADYITRTVRERLQTRFGAAGRGFVAIDQRAMYGGRRLKRTGWRRTRIVDDGAEREPFGFSGMCIEATRPEVSASFTLEEADDRVRVYYLAHPEGARFDVYVETEYVTTLDGRSSVPRSLVGEVEIPEHAWGRATAPEWLRFNAQEPGVKLFGLSFESEAPGVLYDVIGPVGADAEVYLSLDPKSFTDHLSALGPALVVLMVGGNDALKVRQGRRTLEQVKQQHVQLIRRIRRVLPESDCLLWAPMDAGERDPDGTIRTKDFITDIRDLQRVVAVEEGCGFWDTYEAMGGRGSFGRWHAEGIMNEDLVHPRAQGGDLLGHLFWSALMETYLEG